MGWEPNGRNSYQSCRLRGSAMEKATSGEGFYPEKYGSIFRPGSRESLDDARGVNNCGVCGRSGLIRHLKGLHLDKVKRFVRKLAKSAGLTLTSYDSSQIGEIVTQYKDDYFFSESSIATLVKSILLENGVSSIGSTGAFELKKGEKTTSLIRKRRVWWRPVPGASSYVVYASEDRTIFEPDHFSWEKTPGIISRPFLEKTELIIPDDWPEFPMEPGTYYIGITARDDIGNESDPFMLMGLFKFLAPPPPSKGGIDSL